MVWAVDTVYKALVPETVYVASSEVPKASTAFMGPSLAGFRYYRVVVNSADLGGPNEPMLTGVGFRVDGVLVGGSTVISSDPISGGDVAGLFNDRSDAGSGYVKFVAVPWQVTVDLGVVTGVNELYLSSYDTWFYHVPSSVTVYGSNDLDRRILPR